MSRSTVRLVLTLTAAGLVGAVVVDVVGVLWLQGRIARERGARLRLAALAAAPHLAPDGDLATLAVAAEGLGVVLSVAKSDGILLSPRPDLLPGGPWAEGRGVHGGYEHVAVPLGGQGDLLVASQPLAEGLDELWRVQRSALWLLAAGILVTVGVAATLLRRQLLKPLERITTWVTAQDYDSLRAVGGLASLRSADDIVRLGRGITAMHQRIESDRARLAAQLDELQSAHADLENAQARLVRTARLAAVGQLAAGLAHEVGNPLGAIRGLVDLLQAELPDGDPDLRRAADRISKEVDRIQRTVRSLLDFSRGPDARGSGEVATAFQHLRGLLGAHPRAAGLTMEVVDPPGGWRVALNTDALTQVLLNLALNAVDALKERRERDAASLGDGCLLRVHAEVTPQGLAIHVDDAGGGVPAEARAHLFEPFYSTKPAGAGTGLGLAICERMASDVGGELHVGDSPLGGARFTLVVPPAAER